MKRYKQHITATKNDSSRDRSLFKVNSARILHAYDQALDAEELALIRSSKPVLGIDAAPGSRLRTSLKCQSSHKLNKLTTLCITFLAHNINDMSAEHLAALPSNLANELWEHVNNELLDDLTTFLKFAHTHPQLCMTKMLNVSIADVARMLNHILQRPYDMGAMPSSTNWLIDLDLSHMPVAEDVLLQLGTLPNLAVLKVDDAGLSDATIRHWHRAQSVGRFQSLQLLDIHANDNIRNLPDAVTKLCDFRHLVLLRCDHFSATTRQEQERLEHQWKEVRGATATRLSIRTHLGSRGDSRPVTQGIHASVYEVKQLEKLLKPQPQAMVKTTRKRKQTARVDQAMMWSSVWQRDVV